MFLSARTDVIYSHDSELFGKLLKKNLELALSARPIIGLSDTHSVVDDVDLQVDDSFGPAGQLLIFQQVALLLSISDLTSQTEIGSTPLEV